MAFRIGSDRGIRGYQVGSFWANRKTDARKENAGMEIHLLNIIKDQTEQIDNQEEWMICNYDPPHGKQASLIKMQMSPKFTQK